MPWIPSDRFSCHVVLCTSICSLLVVRCTSHAEASKQLVLEHRCQPCQPCQIMPGDPVDLRNSHANKGRKLSAPNNRALFGLSKAQACSFCASVVVDLFCQVNHVDLIIRRGNHIKTLRPWPHAQSPSLTDSWPSCSQLSRPHCGLNSTS